VRPTEPVQLEEFRLKPLALEVRLARYLHRDPSQRGVALLSGFQQEVGMAGLGATTTSASVSLSVGVVDLTTSNLPDELAKIDARLHVLDGILDALSRSAQVNRTVQLSTDRYAALRALQAAPYSYTQPQAQAVLDMPVGWQCLEHVDALRKERDELASRRLSLRDHLSEVFSLHWFG
jgi:hypothetical protein